MAQRIESKSLVPINKSVAFPRIATFFDGFEYLIERIGHLVEKADYPVFRLAFFLYLLYKLAEYGAYLVSKWHGS
jgi:hypothetical protein